MSTRSGGVAAPTNKRPKRQTRHTKKLAANNIKYASPGNAMELTEMEAVNKTEIKTNVDPEVPPSVEVPSEEIDRAHTKHLWSLSAGSSQFPFSKISQKEKCLLNVARSLKKAAAARKSFSMEPTLQSTMVIFYGLEKTLAVMMQQKGKVIKSKLKGSNKSIKFEESGEAAGSSTAKPKDKKDTFYGQKKRPEMNEAKRTVMRDKTYTVKEKSVARNENRTIIKGVRTNRRFELLLKMRNIC